MNRNLDRRWRVWGSEEGRIGLLPEYKDFDCLIVSPRQQDANIFTRFSLQDSENLLGITQSRLIASAAAFTFASQPILPSGKYLTYRSSAWGLSG